MLTRHFKLCRHCRSNIPSRAHVCPKCQKYQSWWSDPLLFVANISTLLVILVSGLTFLRGEYWPKQEKVVVVDMRTDGFATLANPGEMDVYVSEVKIEWTVPTTDVNGMVRFADFPVRALIRPERTCTVLVGDRRRADFVSVQNMEEESFAKLLSYNEPGDHFYVSVLQTSDAYSRLVEHYGDSTRVFECKGSIEYFPAGSDEGTKEPLPKCATFLAREMDLGSQGPIFPVTGNVC